MGNNMKYAIIENGVVTNVALADSPLASNWVASDAASIGWAYDGANFTAPAVYVPTLAEQSSSVRSKRTGLLKETDWTQLADSPADSATWAIYRQALRDITKHPSFPNLSDSDWPVKLTTT